jgi:hypothetical protein
MDLLTTYTYTYTHDSELQVITAPSLFSTLFKSLLQTQNLLQPAVSSLAVLWQRLLTVEILQLHILTSLLSAEYPATDLKSTIKAKLLYDSVYCLAYYISTWAT